MSHGTQFMLKAFIFIEREKTKLIMIKNIGTHKEKNKIHLEIAMNRATLSNRR